MNNLPYIFPEEDLELNLLLVVFIIKELNATKTGKLILNNERLTIYVYLIKNPHILNKLLIRLSKNKISLKSYEQSSFKSENQDLETLYNTKIVKFYVQILVSKKFVDIKYDKKIGFVYTPSEKIFNEVENINVEYFNRVLKFIEKTRQINSIAISSINTNLKNILNKGN